MKKLLITTVLTLSFIISYCQVSYEKYTMSQFQNKEYDIKYTEKNKMLHEVYLYGQSLESANQDVILVINAKDLKVFTDYLTALKDKYMEWTKTAEDNNVTELNKDIPIINRDKYAVIWEYSNYHIDRNTKLNSKVSISDGVNSLLLFTGKVYSSSNRYIDNPGFFVSFNSIEEVEDLVAKLNPDIIQSFIEKSRNKDSLFQ